MRAGGLVASAANELEWFRENQVSPDVADPPGSAGADSVIAANVVDFPLRQIGLSRPQRATKRTFDVIFAVAVLILSAPLLLLLALAVRLTSRGPAFFRQERVGRGGCAFKVIKLRTMHSRPAEDSTITLANDPRVTVVGGFLRATRLDELPQLWNVLKGEMSLVGPRPDVPGFADELRGSDRRLLTLRPGITGPATLYFRNEGVLLADHPDPVWYNDHVIYPQKVVLNLAYLDAWSFAGDLGFLLITALPGMNRWLKIMPEPEPEEQRLVAARAAESS